MAGPMKQSSKEPKNEMSKKNREIEVRFLEIDPQELKQRLVKLNAKDLGEQLLQELIFYDQALNWQYKEKKQVRIRKKGKDIFLAFKHAQEKKADGTIEIEFKIEDVEKGADFLKALGLLLFRRQERKRHSFLLNQVLVEIDYYPKVPPLVELEGPSEVKLKQAAKLLNLDWENRVLELSRFIIEKRYKIPVSKLKVYTFKQIS